jgi:hypothetical protein
MPSFKGFDPIQVRIDSALTFQWSSDIGPDEAEEEEDNAALEDPGTEEAEVDGILALVLGFTTPWAAEVEEDLGPEFKTLARARLPLDIFIKDCVGVIDNLK